MIKTIVKVNLIALFAIGMLSCRPSGQESQVATADDTEGWEILFDGTSTDKWKSYCGDGFPSGG
jgi:hypothetical protein